MIILAVPLLALLVQAPPLPGAEASPAQRFQQARAMFDEGRYDEAAALFRELHERTGDPVLLAPIAQSLRKADRCPAALSAYESLLEAELALRQRAAAASESSDLKRLDADLDHARARVVEMRICAARHQAEPARKAAFGRLAAGEHAEALKALGEIWESNKDPTLPAELAEIHRGQGRCPEAMGLLDQGIAALAPIEILGSENLGRDAASAREALRRARAAKLEFRCTPAVPVPLVRGAIDDDPITTTAQSLVVAPAAPVARKRWPLYVAIGGGVLAAGGVASWGMMTKARDDFDLAKRSTADEQRRIDLYNRGRTYQWLGATLVGVGASAATASLLYWFFSADRPAATAVVEPRPGGVTVALRSNF